MVTRKAWIPGVGICSAENSNEANNLTNGTITLGPVPVSREVVEEQEKAIAEALDRKEAQLDLLLMCQRRSWRKINTEPKVVG